MKKDKNGNINCHNSTWCHNSTGCHNSTCLIYCSDLFLEKFKVFNKSVRTKEVYLKIRDKIQSQLGYYKHPKHLTKKDINWLKKNVKQFDEKVLNKIIKDSILPDKPKEEKIKGEIKMEGKIKCLKCGKEFEDDNYQKLCSDCIIV